MLRTALIFAAALALSACGDPDNPDGTHWVPDPAKQLQVGTEVVAASPLPAECGDLGNSTGHMKVVAFPAAETVQVQDRVVIQWLRTVPRHCVVAMTLR